MALYTPPPSSGPFNSSLPALLPHELVHACNFGPHKVSELMTPPVSTRSTHLEYIADEDDSMSEDEEPKPSPLSDWFSTSHCRTSFGHIAEKTCEMVCYLWFSTNSSSPSSRRHQFVPGTTPSTASLQFCVSQNFVQFMQKVLETTQVSQSVIVLSLHYIYRLKERNRLTNGESGSEFRVAVAALMMANKFVDDNTYTNKTWSDVSGIPLKEVNKMEREILLGIDFSLYVDKATYESWLNLLNGLCMAKEKDSLHWRRSSSSRSRLARGSVPSNVWSSANRSASAYSTPSRSRTSHRARSTSPPMQSFRYPFTFTAPNTTSTPSYAACDTPTKPGAKRSAADAFSPSSTSCPPAKAPKRQMGVPALSLSIPNTHLAAPVATTQVLTGSPKAQRTSHSPMDGLGLHHFSKLTLATNSPAVTTGASADTPKDQSTWVSSERQHVPPKTLSASWTQDRGACWAAPQNLYYYSLACSPASRENHQADKPDQESISVVKKAKLRYHPAPQTKPSPSENNPAAPARDAVVFANRVANRLPMVVQSASTSPNMRDTWLDYRQPSYQPSRSHLPANSYPSHHQYNSPARLSVASSGSTPSSESISTPASADAYNDVHMDVPPTLPPFNELVSGADVPYPSIYSYGPQSYDNSPMQPRVVDHSNGLQAAPFANAGPPGVHQYGYPCGGMEFQPYANTYAAYAPVYSQGYAGMNQYAATAGWVRTR